jgi:hypothetical protein
MATRLVVTKRPRRSGRHPGDVKICVSGPEGG